MKIKIVESESKNDELEIYEMLRAYNLSKREASENIPLDIYYEDDAGKKMAGLVAETFGNWLCIKYLFVSEVLRGRGIGKEMIRMAEKTARDRGCKYVFVDTFDFQAPEFYKKLGFREVFQLQEYPYTGTRFYYTRKL